MKNLLFVATALALTGLLLAASRAAAQTAPPGTSRVPANPFIRLASAGPVNLSGDFCLISPFRNILFPAWHYSSANLVWIGNAGIGAREMIAVDDPQTQTTKPTAH